MIHDNGGRGNVGMDEEGGGVMQIQKMYEVMNEYTLIKYLCLCKWCWFVLITQLKQAYNYAIYFICLKRGCDDDNNNTVDQVWTFFDML